MGFKQRNHGTIRNFDVDFSPCTCFGLKPIFPGEKTPSYDFRVIRVDYFYDDITEAATLSCTECGHTWLVENVRRLGTGIELSAHSHPDQKYKYVNTTPK